MITNNGDGSDWGPNLSQQVCFHILAHIVAKTLLSLVALRKRLQAVVPPHSPPVPSDLCVGVSACPTWATLTFFFFFPLRRLFKLWELCAWSLHTVQPCDRRPQTSSFCRGGVRGTAAERKSLVFVCVWQTTSQMLPSAAGSTASTKRKI